MAWKGNDPAIEFKTIDSVREYIRSLDYRKWRPSNFVVHNTASPTLYQWWHSVPPAQRMENLQSYYENDMGWSAGPHFFIDGESWWCMTPPNVKGVHSPSWNGTMLGFEHVGDYDTEDPTTGMGLKVQEMGQALSGECCAFFGWDPSNLKFHYEDPKTTHACPGSKMKKPDYIGCVQEYMGDGGDDHTPPYTPIQGTVVGLTTGDTLNIRASASSSAPIIGTADNGDVFTIVGEAWNGSTKWLRLQFGTPEGSGVAVFGWASSQYIHLEGGTVEQAWHENITATVFGNAGDEQDSAYPDIDYITGSTKGVSFPYKWRESPRPRIEVVGPNGPTIVDVIDVGPWNTNDPRYVIDGERPLAEKQYEQGLVAQNGQV